MKCIVRFIALVMLLSVAFAFASCDEAKDNNHTHRYSPDWSYDDSHHCHKAVCNLDIECLYVTSDFGEHSLAFGVCSVCGYIAPSDGEDDNNPDSDNPADDNDNSGDDNPGDDPVDDPDDGNGNGNDNTPDNPVCTIHQYVCESVAEPTCTIDGENKFTCSVCGDFYTESVAAIGHSEEDIPPKQPTCTENGLSTGKKCSVCDEITKAQIEISALGHRYDEGLCTVCGETDPDYIPPDPNAIYISTTQNYCWVDKVSFTSSENGEYTFTLPAGLGAWDVTHADNGAPGPVIDCLHPNYIANESSFTVFIAEGETYEFYIAATVMQEWVIHWSFFACDPPAEPEIPDEPEEPIDISGTYYGTDAFGNQQLNIVIDSAAGSVIFNYHHHLTGPSSVNATYTVTDGIVSLFDENGIPLNPLSGTLTLIGGVPAYASYNATQYSLSTEAPDNGGTGSGDGEIKVIRGIMIDEQENVFTIIDEDLLIDKMYVKFTPVNSGVYDFNSVHIFVASITKEDGTPADKNIRELYILESYVTYIVEINLEYVAHTGDYSITPVYHYPEGHPKNPIWYTLGSDAVATYNGDYQPVWHQFYADKTGTLTVSTNTPGATILIAAVPNFDIASEETLTLGVVQGRKYYIGVIAYDSGDAVDIEFTAKITDGDISTDGSVNAPHIITLGNNSVSIDEASGMYFIYKSEQNGIFTLSGAEGFGWCITDFTDQVHTSDDDISVHLFVGDLIYFYVETVDAIEAISFNASFTRDSEQIFFPGPFVTDGSAENELTLEENTYGVFRFTGTVGSFIFSWDNPSATITVDGVVINNGDTVEITDAWFAPFFRIHLEDYASGTVNLTIIQKN